LLFIQFVVRDGKENALFPAKQDPAFTVFCDDVSQQTSSKSVAFSQQTNGSKTVRFCSFQLSLRFFFEMTLPLKIGVLFVIMNSNFKNITVLLEKTIFVELLLTRLKIFLGFTIDAGLGYLRCQAAGIRLVTERFAGAQFIQH
jgi:hypothetical protein